MPRSRSLALVLAAVAFAAVPAADLATPASAQTDDALTRDLDAITTSPALAGADVGLVVRHADTGALVYSRESDERGQPASNGKLISSATALDILGPDHRFRTTAAASGRHRAGVLAGDLHLRGTGDPTMLAADYDAREFGKAIRQIMFLADRAPIPAFPTVEKANAFIMSIVGMPSVMQTTSGMPASAASITASAAPGGGTKITEALAPVACTAS